MKNESLPQGHKERLATMIENVNLRISIFEGQKQSLLQQVRILNEQIEQLTVGKTTMQSQMEQLHVATYFDTKRSS